jgi:hypothetical protein
MFDALRRALNDGYRGLPCKPIPRLDRNEACVRLVSDSISLVTWRGWPAPTLRRHAGEPSGKIHAEVIQADTGTTTEAGRAAATLEFRQAAKRYPGQGELVEEPE